MNRGQRAALLAAPLLSLALAGGAAPPVTPEPAKGDLLVAERSLVDPNFARTVVLLIEHDDSGAMGLIVNRPTEVRLEELDLPIEHPERLPETVFLGGPVSRPELFLLLRSEADVDGAARVFADVHFSARRDVLSRLLERDLESAGFRLYSGYAGWGPGQLEGELRRGGWRLVPASPELVFSTRPGRLWTELIERTPTDWAALGARVAQAPM